MKKILVKWKLTERERRLYGDAEWAQKEFWLTQEKYRDVRVKVKRVETEPGKPERRPVGRPAKYKNNAARQQAYRRRKRARRQEAARQFADELRNAKESQ